MFRKAERKQAKLRLALSGVSGSGKTFSALQIAKGIGGKIAMIDTENGSGELYSDVADYDVVQLSPPFSPGRYIETIRAAEKEGYSILIIDSISHAWSGEGGVLDILDKSTKASRSQNSYTAWKDVTPQQNKFIEAILRSNLHIICTMRSKAAYQMTDDKGKTKPVKIGLAPIQREGVDYEFTVVLELSVDGHIASASKDRTGMFDGQYFVITEDTGKQLLEWLNSGISIEKHYEQLAEKIISDIKNCKTLDELRVLFDSVKKERVQLFDNAKFKERIVNAKEEKKNELTKEAKKVADEYLGEEEPTQNNDKKE